MELARLLREVTGAEAWSREQGARWWRERAPALIVASKTRRAKGSTPGPRTIAVDLEQRTPG